MKVVKQWETDDYILRLQEASGLFFVHCDVFVCTPRVFRELYKALHVDVVNYALSKGKEILYTYSSNKKFIEVMAPDANIIGGDDVKEVYSWVLR